MACSGARGRHLAFLSILASLWSGALSSPVEYLGCFRDTRTRDLPVYMGKPQSYEQCRVACTNHTFFGLQSAGECWCGNTYGMHGASSDCQCADGVHHGHWKNCIYQVHPPPRVEYLGCFRDTRTRDLAVYKGKPQSYEQCKAACSDYPFFGLQSAGECWCGHSYGRHGASSDCQCADGVHHGHWKNCVYQSHVGDALPRPTTLWRLEIAAQTGNASFYEIELYNDGQLINMTNAELQAENEGSRVAADAFDHDEDTFWKPLRPNMGEQLRLEFSEPTRITSLRTKQKPWHRRVATHIDVQASYDGGRTWRSIWLASGLSAGWSSATIPYTVRPMELPATTSSVGTAQIPVVVVVAVCLVGGAGCLLLFVYMLYRRCRPRPSVEKRMTDAADAKDDCPSEKHISGSVPVIAVADEDGVSVWGANTELRATL